MLIRHVGSEARSSWRTLDPNLLVVFGATIELRSATPAAARLNTTRPAVSHALRRLRGALHDELFVRTSNGMEPTPYAEWVGGSVHAAPEEPRATLHGGAVFDLATTGRSFVIALDNRAGLVLAAAAPHVSLDLRLSGTLDLAERLDRTDLDLALGSLAAPGERCSDLRLFENGFTALVRRSHPVKDSGEVTLAALSAFRHLELSSTGGETGFVDAALAEHGLVRRVAIHAPLLAAAAMLTQSELVALVGEHTARTFASIARWTSGCCRSRRRGW